MNILLSCIVCNFQPEVAFDGCVLNQPYLATTFSTSGDYGSTFFDPMDGSVIEINVCDSCLKKAQEKKQINLYLPKVAVDWFDRALNIDQGPVDYHKAQILTSLFNQ